MSKKNIITFLGILTIVLPFLGLPNSIFIPIMILTGVLVIYVARTGTKKKIN